MTVAEMLSAALDVIAPGLGAFGTVLLREVIPGQRADRLAEYVTRLGRRLRVVEGRVDELADRAAEFARSLEPVKTALFQDGASAAVRTTEPDHIDRIAQVVANGLEASEAEAERARELLQVVAELSDVDVVRLCARSHHFGTDANWQDRHRGVIRDIQGLRTETPTDADAAVLAQLSDGRLLRLNLIMERTAGIGPGVTRQITSLGLYVLRHLALLGDEEQ